MYAGRLLCLGPIYRAGAFRDFVGAYFGYNAAYSGCLSIAVRLLHTRQLIIQLFASGLAVLAIAGWSLALRKRSQHGTGEARMPSIYLNILLASVPLEIVAACLSGRDYSHYMLPLFPSLAVLAAWFLVAIQNSASEHSVGAMVALALLFGFLPFCLAVYASDFSQASDPPRPDYIELVKFIQRTTSPNDAIMVVGGTEAGYIALHAQRLPASRCFYQYPLIDAANPVAAEQRRQFMADLMTSRPAVIVSGNPLLEYCVPQNWTARRITLKHRYRITAITQPCYLNC